MADLLLHTKVWTYASAATDSAVGNRIGVMGPLEIDLWPDSKWSHSSTAVSQIGQYRSRVN